MDTQAISDAVHASIAKTVLEGLDTDARDAILQKSIAAVIGDYKFRSSIEDVVAAKAGRVVAELVESEDWESRITGAIQRGFDDYLSNLRSAIPGVIALSLHGKDGDGYSKQVAAILGRWPKST